MKRRALFQLHPSNPISQYEDVQVIPDCTPQQIAGRRKFRALRPQRTVHVEANVKEFQIAGNLVSREAERKILGDCNRPVFFSNAEVRVNSPVTKLPGVLSPSNNDSFRSIMNSGRKEAEIMDSFLSSANDEGRQDTPKVEMNFRSNTENDIKSIVSVPCVFGYNDRDIGPGRIEILLCRTPNSWVCLLVFRNTIGSILFKGVVPSVSVWKLCRDQILYHPGDHFEVGTDVSVKQEDRFQMVSCRVSLGAPEWLHMRQCVQNANNLT